MNAEVAKGNIFGVENISYSAARKTKWKGLGFRNLERSCKVISNHKGESISQLLQHPVVTSDGLGSRSGKRSWSL